MKAWYSLPICLQAIEKFGIAKSFPVDSEASFAGIAKFCNLSEDDVRRILRQAMTQHIFKEPRKAVMAHTAVSKLLAEDPLAQDHVAFCCREEWAASPHVVDTMIKWPGPQEPEHSVWTLGNGRTGGIATEIIKEPERASRVPGAMNMVESSEGSSIGHFINAFDWTGAKKFADVGGASGSVCVAAINSVPVVLCVVQDVPVVIQLMKTIPHLAHVASRLEYKEHDFFTPQTEKDADVYFFPLDLSRLERQVCRQDPPESCAGTETWGESRGECVCFARFRGSISLSRELCAVSRHQVRHLNELIRKQQLQYGDEAD